MSVLGVPRARPRRGFVPGEPGLWVFIFADLSLFAFLFGTVIVLRDDHPAVFAAGQAALHPALGAVNTILLLTGSLFVVMAVDAVRRGGAGAAGLLRAAQACGVGFLVVKGFDWGGAIAAGHTPSSSEFFGLYYMLTGIHLVHVGIGLGVLAAMRRGVLRGTATPGFLEGGACYWHMVDLLWVVLFPLVFLSSP